MPIVALSATAAKANKAPFMLMTFGLLKYGLSTIISMI
ncbi:hypothetical protein CZ794_11225 [Psychrobacter sp. JB385]|nr:hypothetical protein CZ794_11225 [Psychrobacter sp. JB385]